MEEIQINNNKNIHNSKTNPKKKKKNLDEVMCTFCYFTIFELMKQKLLNLERDFSLKNKKIL
jgi:hypothetical protein